MADYEVVWNGAHRWANYDLLRPVMLSVTVESVVLKEPVTTRRRLRQARAFRPRASLEKYCHECGQQFYLRCASEGKQHHPNGRRFCSAKCSAIHTGRLNCGPHTALLLPDALTSIDTARHRARRWYKVEPCEVCGTLVDIHRHHRDGNPINNARENIAFLCKPHHEREHAFMIPRV